MNISELNAHWGRDGRVRFEELHGLTAVTLSAPGGSAQVFTHGAHVTHFQPTGAAPVLFVSCESEYAAQKPIRGGVPVIFPWFGPHPSGDGPLHGTVRLAEWSVQTVEVADDFTRLVLGYAPDSAPHPSWPGACALHFAITVGADLRLELTVENRDSAPLRYEEALHTYFAVGDACQISLEGLQGARFLDKTEDFAEKTQSEAQLALTGETDRVYLQNAGAVTIHDPVLQRRIIVAKANSQTTVVWNPWIAKAAAMPDFGDDEWTQMLCVETANAGVSAIEVPPGQSHTMTAIISVEAV